MIEFFGENSDKCKTIAYKKRDNSLFIVMLVSIIVLTIITLIIWIATDEDVQSVFVGLGICIVITALLKIQIIYMPNWLAKLKLINKITIEDDKITFTQKGHPMMKNGKTLVKHLAKVKKVVDEGEWYCIYFGKMSDFWVCEKSLLVSGTLEDFEKVFKDKMQKRHGTK